MNRRSSECLEWVLKGNLNKGIGAMSKQPEKKPDKIVDRVLYGVDVPIFRADGKLLMLKRSVASEKFRTGWEFVKGGLKVDESYVDAAFREAAEEAAGLSLTLITEIDRDFEVDARYRNKPHYDYVRKRAVVLFASGDSVSIDAKEHSEYRWMTLEEARDVIWVENGPEILDAAKDAYLKWATR